VGRDETGRVVVLMGKKTTVSGGEMGGRKNHLGVQPDATISVSGVDRGCPIERPRKSEGADRGKDGWQEKWDCGDTAGPVTMSLARPPLLPSLRSGT